MLCLAEIHEILITSHGFKKRHDPERTIWNHVVHGLLEDLVEAALLSGPGSDALMRRLGAVCDTFPDLYDALDAEGWLHPTFYSSDASGTRLLPHGDLAMALRSEIESRKGSQ